MKNIKQKGKHTDTDFVSMRFSKWAKDYDVVTLTVFSNIESYMVDNPEMARWCDTVPVPSSDCRVSM